MLSPFSSHSFTTQSLNWRVRMASFFGHTFLCIYSWRPDNKLILREPMHFVFECIVLQPEVLNAFYGRVNVRRSRILLNIADREAMFEDNNIIILCQYFKRRFLQKGFISCVLYPDIIVIKGVIIPPV